MAPAFINTNNDKYDFSYSLYIHWQIIRNYLMCINHSNIILFSIPFRYDLQNYPAMNMKISILNKKLHKLIRVLLHTKFSDSNNDRKLFTKHGLHHNKLGKYLVTSQVACHILATFQHRASSPLPLGWYEPI